MDSKIIKCDVDFGMTVDPVFASKASPSHESDSGCSDMSEVRSVSPLSDVDFMATEDESQVDLFDFESVADDELDRELETYFAVPLASHDRSTLKTPEAPVCEQSSSESSSPDPEQSEIDVLSNDPEYLPSKRIIQSKAIRGKEVPEAKPHASVIKVPFMKNAQTDIHILPSSKVSSSGGKCKSKSSPAIKVVKVVKTTAQSKQDIDNELLQALDDRNKKNAVQAKMNREKKKVYVKNLEDEIEELKCENFTLKENNRKVQNDRNKLQEEVEYLKSVLANQSELSSLLKNIGNVQNVKLSSSLNRKRSADLDHDYHSMEKRQKLSVRKTAGVCLHVDQGNVSLEFCSKCASMVKSGEKEGNS